MNELSNGFAGFYIKLTAAVLICLVCAQSLAAAQTTYTATVFPNAPGTFQANGSFSDQLVAASGSATVTNDANAVLLNTLAGPSINLDPGYYGSIGTCEDGQYQGGYYNPIQNVYYSRKYNRYIYSWVTHAALWHGSDKSLVDLHPTGQILTIYNGTSLPYESYVLGMSNGQQIGYVYDTAEYDHAFLWNGTAASGVDLTPAGWFSSNGAAIDNGYEVGAGDSPGQVEHALMWQGSAASYTDLQSTTLSGSTIATGVDAANDIQVGDWYAPSGYYYYVEYAVLWHGAADSLTNLNPASCISSLATAASDGYQVGYGYVATGVTHALVWQGTVASCVDLHQFLPPGYTSSEALSVDHDGNIVGIAYNTSTASEEAVVWSPASRPTTTAAQLPLPNKNGWTTTKTTVTIESPFTAPKSYISYALDSGAQIRVGGSTANINVKLDGTNFIEYFAHDGATGANTATGQYTVNIDTTVPKTTLTFGGGVVTLAAADDPGDRPVTYYSLDGGAQTTFTAPFTVQNFVHSLKYWSVDLAGNTEVAHTSKLGAVGPTLTSISPARSLTTTSSVTLTATGTGFNPYSEIDWNGAPLPTTYINSTSLTAVIPASDLSVAETSKVDVINPSPGLGHTSSRVFTIAPYASAAGGINQDTVGTTTFDLTPINSAVGFTPIGHSLPVITNSQTVFLNPYGVNIGSGGFFGAIIDGPSNLVTVTGVYSAGKFTAWIAQLNN